MINVAALDGNTTTPTIIYALTGNDSISASGMTANVWFVGGAGSDTMTGGSGSNSYLYAAVADLETPNEGSNLDQITDFNPARDIINFAGMTGGTITAIQGLITGTTRINAHSIAWIQDGTETIIYANIDSTSHRQDSSSGFESEIILQNFNAANLSATDFVLSNPTVVFTLDSSATDVSNLTAGNHLNATDTIGTFAALGGTGAITYSLSGVNASSFSLNAGTGVLEVGAGNVTVSQLYALTVTATDQVGNSFAQNFDIWLGTGGNNTVNLASIDGNTSTPTIAYDLSGNDSITTGNMSADVWVVAGSGGTSGNLTVNATGMTGDLTVILPAAWASGDSLTGGLGSNTLVLNGSNAVDNLTTGNFTGFEDITLNGGNDTLTLTNDDLSVTVTGTGDTMVLGGGNDTVLSAAGNNTVTLGNGTDTVNFSGDSNTVNATASTLLAADNLTGAGSDTLALRGGGTINLNTPNTFTGFPTVTEDNSNTALTLRNGETLSVILGNGTDSVTGGTGAGAHATVNFWYGQ